MIKPRALKKGDKVAIVSLSSGMLGEDFCGHYIELGKKRLNELGLDVEFMPNSLRGIKYLEENPKSRFDDLKQAFLDKSIKAIICAIGGEDTYKLAEYFFEDDEFKEIVRCNPKIFTGFSDTSVNHLMFYKIGLKTFYGASYINDFCEMDKDMLSYTKEYIKKYYFNEEIIPIKSADIWYEERTDFSKKQMGIKRVSHKEDKGYELIQGKEVFEGELIGGCVESLYELLSGVRHCEAKITNDKYNIFPSEKDLKGKILFLETSESKSRPEYLEKMLLKFKEKKVFDNISGIIVGKPQDEVFYQEYKEIYKKVIDNETLPILFNVNFGHSFPRCILQYDAKVMVDSIKKEIVYLEELF